MAYLLANFRGNDFLLPDGSDVNISVARLSLKLLQKSMQGHRTKHVSIASSLRENTFSSHLHSHFIKLFQMLKVCTITQVSSEMEFHQNDCF